MRIHPVLTGRGPRGKRGIGAPRQRTSGAPGQGEPGATDAPRHPGTAEANSVPADDGLSHVIPRPEALELVDLLKANGGALNPHTQTASYIERSKAAYFAEQQNQLAENERLAGGSGDEAAEPRRLNPIDVASRLSMSMIDSGNDLSVTGRATAFVAICNATPEVKAAADAICNTCEHDSIASWLAKHL